MPRPRDANHKTPKAHDKAAAPITASSIVWVSAARTNTTAAEIITTESYIYPACRSVKALTPAAHETTTPATPPPPCAAGSVAATATPPANGAADGAISAKCACSFCALPFATRTSSVVSVVASATSAAPLNGRPRDDRPPARRLERTRSRSDWPNARTRNVPHESSFDED